jgi:5-methylcytosine-specific restriction endonuclease McrA
VYCGLDGRHVFENWLVLTIDHIHPHAHGGPRRMDNLVTACRPCNLMKGKHVFKSFEDAKQYIQGKREEWRNLYKKETHPGGS